MSKSTRIDHGTITVNLQWHQKEKMWHADAEHDNQKFHVKHERRGDATNEIQALIYTALFGQEYDLTLKELKPLK